MRELTGAPGQEVLPRLMNLNGTGGCTGGPGGFVQFDRLKAALADRYAIEREHAITEPAHGA